MKRSEMEDIYKELIRGVSQEIRELKEEIEALGKEALKTDNREDFKVYMDFVNLYFDADKLLMKLVVNYIKVLEDE